MPRYSVGAVLMECQYCDAFMYPTMGGISLGDIIIMSPRDIPSINDKHIHVSNFNVYWFGHNNINVKNENILTQEKKHCKIGHIKRYMMLFCWHSLE